MTRKPQRRRDIDLPAFLGRQDGAAALEFAIIAPVFILLVTGMIAYAIYFGAAHSVQQLAADAARTSIAGLSAQERSKLVSNFIASNAGDYVLIDPKALTYQVGQKVSDPSEYNVTISLDASYLPIWNLYVPLPLPSRQITYSSAIRMGGI